MRLARRICKRELAVTSAMTRLVLFWAQYMLELRLTFPDFSFEFIHAAADKNAVMLIQRFAG